MGHHQATTDLRTSRRRAVEAWERHVVAGPGGCRDAADGVREVVSRSWVRSAPHVPLDADAAPVDAADLAVAWRRSPLHDPVKALRHELDRAVDDGSFVAAVTDATGRILWTHGSRWMRSRAERVNFVPGGRWDEASIGTNALDLALRTAAPQQVFSAEHFSRVVHDWVCYSAPIIDPRSGQPLGVVDLSTTWDRANALALSTATMIGTALGQLVRGDPSADGTPVVDLHLLGSTPAVRLDGRPVALSPRQVEILAVLAAHPEGLSLDALHARIYPDLGVATGTLKAEVSHLRRALGGGIDSRPYRLVWPAVSDAQHVADLLAEGAVDRAADAYAGPLLPGSEAPWVVRQRTWLLTALRASAGAAASAAALFRLGGLHPEDLELHERCLHVLDHDDPRRAVVEARLRVAWAD